MDDSISRKMAIDKMQMFIDSLDKEATAYKSLRVAFNRCIIELKRLPSAQPETHDKRTETHECDLINRQQAIDAVVSAMIDGADAELVEGVMELLPSAQPEQNIAQERYVDLCEYFKDCSDQGRSILNDRKEFKSWLDRMKWHVMECDKLGRELEKLKSAQPETHDKRTETQINTLDCVSRQAAIDALGEEPEVCEYDDEYGMGQRSEWRYIKKKLETLPSAHQRWIPCSERLPEHPENDDYYLVTIQCEHYDGWDDYVTGFAEWTKNGWDELSCYIGQIKVIAWMPLPKPYGGESE